MQRICPMKYHFGSKIGYPTSRYGFNSSRNHKRHVNRVIAEPATAHRNLTNRNTAFSPSTSQKLARSTSRCHMSRRTFTVLTRQQLEDLQQHLPGPCWLEEPTRERSASNDSEAACAV